MKIFLFVFLSIFYVSVAAAQNDVSIYGTKPVKRAIRFKYINQDSIDLAMNDDFELIEDSCSQIIRHAHLKNRKFFGQFTDVSHADPKLIITEGNYNTLGQKDGHFTSRYLNGDMQAKGDFKDNKFDGRWELFYTGNKPRLIFEAMGSEIKIIDAWNNKGAKTVENGKGNYRVDVSDIYWKGKLLNGRPDGTWRAVKTDDATNTDIVTEDYKSGSFVKGEGPFGSYNDAARLILVPIEILPFTRAEWLRISSLPCNQGKMKHIVDAQYSNGRDNFSERIKDAMSVYLGKVDLKPYDNNLDINGEINEQGSLVNLTSVNAFNEQIADGIKLQLRRLPSLKPATIDGKPVKQKFVISFNFSQGYYSFGYRFLPITINYNK